MNITKPNYKGRWPKCSYFGVFDGHGGDTCSNFLKENMHKYVLANLVRLQKINIFQLNLFKHLKRVLKKLNFNLYVLPKHKIHLKDLEAVRLLF
jgi:serine/threonine protein phosphatase PrpC